MPITYSQAKIYKNIAGSLVMQVCYRDIFHGNLDHHSVRRAFKGTIDFESDYRRRIFFRCDGIEYTIRFLNIVESPYKTGRTKIEYTCCISVDVV